MNTPFYGRRFARGLLLISSLLALQLASASVVITGTRVIYSSSVHEETVKLTNNGNAPALIQAWIDNGDPSANPDTAQAPFILTPPIARIDSQKGQTLRIRFIGQHPLPQDKESIFWLNVLELPPHVEDNTNKLKIAIRSRIKLFYRPTGLQGDAQTAASQLQWRAKGNSLKVNNPSAYYVTLNKVSVAGKVIELSLENALIAPGQTLSLPAQNPVSAGSRISYSTINDFGSVNPHQQLLKLADERN